MVKIDKSVVYVTSRGFETLKDPSLMQGEFKPMFQLSCHWGREGNFFVNTHNCYISGKDASDDVFHMSLTLMRKTTVSEITGGEEDYFSSEVPATMIPLLRSEISRTLGNTPFYWVSIPLVEGGSIKAEEMDIDNFGVSNSL